MLRYAPVVDEVLLFIVAAIVIVPAAGLDGSLDRTTGRACSGGRGFDVTGGTRWN